MKEVEKLLEIMQSLRDPESGCPWSRVQTIDSIKGYTIEEAYELVDAIERNDMAGLQDELGDLLFHVIFYSALAAEQGLFDFQDVVTKLNEKLERRHPDVFSDRNLENESPVKALWEAIKRTERERSSADDEQKNLLDDISKHLPAMQRAAKLQNRAASVGFDWSESAQILDKIQEELNELRAAVQTAENHKHINEELGDLLFCCINLARRFGLEPELALRETNEKFIRRFNYIEQSLAERNKTLHDAGLEEMDALWDEAKGDPV